MKNSYKKRNCIFLGDRISHFPKIQEFQIFNLLELKKFKFDEE